MTNEVEELCRFLHIGARLDLKMIALENLLGLTASDDGLSTLIGNSKLHFLLISLLDDSNASVSKEAALCLVNISAAKEGPEVLLNINPEDFCVPLQTKPENIVNTVLKFILDPNSHIADPCCMVLSNLSRPENCIDRVVDLIEKSGNTFESIINVFTKSKFNAKGASLHYLGPVLSNLSQSSRVRKFILSKSNLVIQRLLPFTEFKDSIVRRGGVVGTLKNCCFESDYHSWLLGEDVDILPRLLLPLAGNEVYDDEDTDKLPEELQYLPSDKEREFDPDIRCILIEALTQLCAIKENREFIRDKNAYVILRDLHKIEKDDKVLLALENLVNILIRTEEEIGHDNLKELNVPNDLTEKFNKLDTDG